jgi:hypothetical protein
MVTIDFFKWVPVGSEQIVYRGVQALSVPRTCLRSSDDLTAEVKNIVHAEIDSKSVVLPVRLKYPEQEYFERLHRD